MLSAFYVVRVIKLIRMTALENKYFGVSSLFREWSTHDEMGGEEEGGSEEIRRLLQ